MNELKITIFNISYYIFSQDFKDLYLCVRTTLSLHVITIYNSTIANPTNIQNILALDTIICKISKGNGRSVKLNMESCQTPKGVNTKIFSK